MQRWHLTAALSGTAVLAALLAPRLAALTSPGPAPSPVVPPEAPPAPEPPVHEGHLVVKARLDQAAVLAGTSTDRFLAVTVTAPELEGEQARRPVDLAVVLDASGSMSARGKIDYAKRAAKLLATAMEPGDTYSLVTFEDDASVVVPATGVEDPAAIHRAIDGVYEGGGTNLYAGLDRGAQEVTRSLRDGAVGRVVLLSDGHANVGLTDPDAISRFAAGLAADGVTVSTIGLGLDYNEDLLARVSDLGGGSYDFVDDPRELEGVFTDELERSASVVARAVSVTIDLGEGVEGLELIGWDGTPQPSGWTVWMGDLYAGETRKIIARVRVDAHADGATLSPSASELHVASARADYHDLIEGRSSSSMSSSHARAIAQITHDPAVVARSVDEEAAVAAHRAWGNRYLDLSTRAYAEGDVDASRRLLEEGRRVLESASQNLQAPKLAEEAEELRKQGDIYESYEPSSREGQRAIKGGKEMFRGRAR